jgi:hypothetical protein
MQHTLYLINKYKIELYLFCLLVQDTCLCCVDSLIYMIKYMLSLCTAIRHMTTVCLTFLRSTGNNTLGYSPHMQIQVQKFVSAFCYTSIITMWLKHVDYVVT